MSDPSLNLSDEEIAAAILLAFRNKNLSEEEMEDVKDGYIGHYNGKCFICSEIIPHSKWISHIRDHLKDLKAFL